MAAQATTLPLVRGRIDTIIDRLTVLYTLSGYREFARYQHKLEAVRNQLLSVSNPPLPDDLAHDVEAVLTELDGDLPAIDRKVHGDYRFGSYSAFRVDWRRYRPELHEYIVFIVRGRLHELRPRARTLPAQAAPPSTMPTLEQPFHPPRSQSHPPPPPHRPATSVGGRYDPHSTSRAAPMPGPHAPQPYQPYNTAPQQQPRSSHSQPPNRHAVPPVIPPPEYFPAPSRHHHHQQQQQPPPPVAYARAPPPPAQYYQRSRTPYPAAPVPNYLAHVYAQSPAMAAERL